MLNLRRNGEFLEISFRKDDSGGGTRFTRSLAFNNRKDKNVRARDGKRTETGVFHAFERSTVGR